MLMAYRSATPDHYYIRWRLMLPDHLQRTVGVYQECHYNFLTTNCHVFVSHFLNEVQYGGRKNWNMVLLVSAQQTSCTMLAMKC